MDSEVFLFVLSSPLGILLSAIVCPSNPPQLFSHVSSIRNLVTVHVCLVLREKIMPAKNDNDFHFLSVLKRKFAFVFRFSLASEKGYNSGSIRQRACFHFDPYKNLTKNYPPAL